MRKFSLILSAACVVLILLSTGSAQIKGKGVEVGISGGAAIGQNEAKAADQTAELDGRFIIGIPLSTYLGLDIGAGMTRNASKGANAALDYKTDLVPVDLRLRLGLTKTALTPYVYAGIGMVHWDVKTPPGDTLPNYEKDGWTGFIPFGVGLQWRLSPGFALDLCGGDNYTFTNYINPGGEPSNQKENGDSYLSFMAGLRIGLGGGNPDLDRDGLTNKEEKILGTDPRNPDTDGDGLDDFAEVNTYKSDPLKADTDGDGLTDGQEVLTYKTDPLKADTDGDKLSDGAEVNQYHTSPLNADSDKDGLNDYAEVMTYKTDPMKADTDGGSVNDGLEVTRGTNPLDLSDDVPKVEAPKKAVIQLETGKAIVLEGIVFKTASADILPASEQILTLALNTLQENPDVTVEIQGHTDNVGKHDSNVKLSLKRAESVKAWLVAKGIAADRLTTKGMGPDHPIADNSTPEGKQQNRRIEFVRVK
jgi:outer membrane protein OmpA-like peptidoglycan-associated protein